MTISTGDRLPEATLTRMGANGAETVDLGARLKGRSVAIFAVPGAFSTTCHVAHLPSFLRNKAAFDARGVDEIICIAVNDPFVMQHWGEVAGTKDKVTMIPDGNGEFTKAIGMDFDGSGYGLATRSKRYSMVVENGKVTKLNVEAKPSDVELSGAQACVVNL